MKATVAVFLQFLRCHKSGADRIQVDVVTDSPDGIAIQQNRLVAALRHMPVFFPEAVEAVGKG